MVFRGGTVIETIFLMWATYVLGGAIMAGLGWLVSRKK